ncbi:MAG: TonB-dependent receptor family protein [Wenzhouxiangella sp.]
MKFFLTWALAGALLYPGITAADTRLFADDEELPRILVRGTPEDQAAAERLDRIPGGTALITREEMQLGRGETLADVLDFAPGVVAQQRFGPEDLRLSVRGSGLNRTGHGRGLMLVMHGMPINAADGNFDMITFDLWQAQRLEIYRGAQAARYGATTLGGVIEMVPRTGRTSAGTEFDASLGSFDFARLRASQGGAGDNADYFFSASAARSDGFRHQSASETLKLHGNFGLRHSANAETRWFLSAATTESEWPGALDRAQFAADPSQAAPVSLARNLGNDINHVIVTQLSTLQLQNGELRVVGSFGHRNQDHPTPGNILLERAQTGLLETGWAQRLGTVGLDLGVRLVQTDSQPRRFDYASPPTSPMAAERGNLIQARDQRARNLEAFGRSAIPLAERWTMDLGLTLTESTRRDTPRDDFGPLNQRPRFSDRYRTATPALGVVWEATDRIQAFAGLSRAFEAPSFFDLDANAPLQADGIPDLDAQKSWTLEIGSRGRTDRLRWDTVLYTSQLDNEILRIDPFGVNPPAVNADRTLRFGAELGLDAVLVDGVGGQLILRQRADLNRFRFDDDPVHGNNTVPGISPRIYRGWLLYQASSGWYAGPTLQAAARTEVDLVNQTQAPGYGIWGFRAGWSGERWSVRTELVNGSDRAWVSTTNILNRAAPASGVFFPGDGRSAYLTVGWSR